MYNLFFCGVLLLFGCETQKNANIALPNLNVQTFDYNQIMQQQKALRSKIDSLKSKQSNI